MIPKTIYLVFWAAVVSTGSSNSKLLQGITFKAILLQFSRTKTRGTLFLGQIHISCIDSLVKNAQGY